MNEHAAHEPVRLFAPKDRERTLAFLQIVDHRFVPPLSSDLRYGSLEAYLDYSLADGQGRVLLYERDGQIIGYLAFRYEQGADGRAGESVYLSNMCVSESLMGTVLIHLYQGMVRQVELDGLEATQRIWAKTWRGNVASSRTLAPRTRARPDDCPGPSLRRLPRHADLRRLVGCVRAHGAGTDDPGKGMTNTVMRHFRRRWHVGQKNVLR